MGEMISSLTGGEANYAIIGCGVEGRGMGWYHALQMLKGEIPRARLSDVVEPFFLGAGKDLPPGKAFAEMAAKWKPKGVQFHASVDSGSLFSRRSSTKIALIAGRTCDNPGFFRQAIKAGATHIFSRSPARRPSASSRPWPARPRRPRCPSTWASSRTSRVMSRAPSRRRRPPAPRPSRRIRTATTTPRPATRVLRAQRRGHAQEHGHPRDRAACQFWGMRADNVVDVICNPKGGKDSPGCDMRTLGGKTDFASVDITLVNSSGTKVRISADRCSGDGCCATVTDTSNGVVLYQQEMVGGERAKKVAAEAKAHPNWFSYLYTQAEEYAKLKGVCAAARPRGHDAAGRGDEIEHRRLRPKAEARLF